MTALILASASPRRLQLLRQIGIEAEVIPAHVDESRFPNETAAEYVQRLALNKASKVAAGRPEQPLIIGADTAVVVDGSTLGKPVSKSDGIHMLERLSGRTHEVLSAVALVQANRREVVLSETNVSFRSLSAEEIEVYWSSGEPADKAGAYAIQGLGAAFVEHIVGSYSGVMGLPLFETARLLRLFGISVI